MFGTFFKKHGLLCVFSSYSGFICIFTSHALHKNGVIMLLSAGVELYTGKRKYRGRTFDRLKCCFTDAG